jgi:hypothetical protein
MTSALELRQVSKVYGSGPTEVCARDAPKLPGKENVALNCLSRSTQRRRRASRSQAPARV